MLKNYIDASDANNLLFALAAVLDNEQREELYREVQESRADGAWRGVVLTVLSFGYAELFENFENRAIKEYR